MSVTSLPLADRQKETPSRTMAWYDWALAVATFVSFPAALYGAFVYAPTEAVQGDVQRIFYFHVPIAWLMYLSFFVVFVASILYLWKRGDQWDRLARCSAEIGVVFTTLVLITGMLWGRPIWGIWWTWDARLTSTLILWAIYVVYLMLRAYSDDRARGARYGAVLGIIGFADVPIVQMSVTWWRTIHPQPVISLEGNENLPPQMLFAMLVSLVAFTLFYVFVMRQRLRIESLKGEIEEIEQLQESER
ncbi:MAG TPA: cytochrome c biogenesis protein CcsA [Chloroflexota bacterium]|nr:cytochrome c biogenesis protein CcsA [Chloroflexota bacterium]